VAYELVPWLRLVLTQELIVMGVKCNIILIDVLEEFLSSQYLGNFNQLVVVVFSLEEGLLLENHSSEHAPE